MDIVSRTQQIILKPKEEWTKIKEEKITLAELFTSYAMILLAIPAIAQFIGMSLVGRRIPFAGWYRMGIGSGLLYAIFFYVFSLVSVYVFGIIINALAPTFSSKSGATDAMKLAVYSMTPVWVAGVLYIIPFLGWLVILAGLYAIYVLYLGFSCPMMETPKEKVLAYLIVSLVVVAILWVVVAVILGAIFAVGGVYSTI
ncbi:MAG: YIP1 family protein [Candidatus Aminicenantes bacterium]|nr:YIP1 family protein [Candidatus Aminicenantes bacterium]MDH5384429.1 YIP1 family protein [Candidatus Aminicenantes bacterium]